MAHGKKIGGDDVFDVVPPEIYPWECESDDRRVCLRLALRLDEMHEEADAEVTYEFDLEELMADMVSQQAYGDEVFLCGRTPDTARHLHLVLKNAITDLEAKMPDLAAGLTDSGT